MVNSIGKLLRFQTEGSVLQVVHSAFSCNCFVIWTSRHNFFHHCHINLFELRCQNTIDFIVILVDERLCINLI